MTGLTVNQSTAGATPAAATPRKDPATTGSFLMSTKRWRAAMVKTCPSCDRPAGALNADVHCKSKTCTWSKCNCGATYDRNKGSGFANKPKPIFYPGQS